MTNPWIAQRRLLRLNRIALMKGKSIRPVSNLPEPAVVRSKSTYAGAEIAPIVSQLDVAQFARQRRLSK